MKPMEMNNIFILKDLISLGGGQIKGRKKMQKIVYIIQELKNPFKPSFKFEWNYYGVYSDELANELRIGEFFNIVKETPIEEYGYHSYAIETVNDTVTKSTPIKENIQLGELMKFLNSKEARVLEVLSSIIFFKQKGFSKEEAKDKLFEFKGHLEGFFDEAYDVLEKLKTE